jgi:hypothetical protein
MNNHEKIRAAIKKLVESEQARDKAILESNVAEQTHSEALAELARQIHNVCPQQKVVCGDRVYCLRGGGLEIQAWDGVVL